MGIMIPFDSENPLAIAVALARTARITVIEPQLDGSSTIKLEIDGVAVAISASDLRIVSGSRALDEFVRDRRAASPLSHTNRLKSRFGPDTPIDELRAHQLPLYWNREWLENEIREHGSLAAAARANGYRVGVVASYAARHHRSVTNPNHPSPRAAAIALWRSEAVSPRRLALEFGVSISTVRRWLEAAEAEPEAPSGDT